MSAGGRSGDFFVVVPPSCFSPVDVDASGLVASIEGELERRFLMR
jgi:hypothetical protein